MNEININQYSTANRIQLLNEYYSQNVLDSSNFVCRHSEECHRSHQGIFYEGQLHHIGKNYDISISGQAFRVMVVGQEYGHGPSHVSMEDRSIMVLDQTGIQKNFTNRNPHMRGTTSLLRLLFGIPLGSNHEDEFLHTINNERFHLFDAFSLVNYLLCSAVNEAESRSGKSTLVMHSNCLNHFIKTVEILDPTVVIVQGKSFWKSIQNAFRNINKISDTLYLAETSHQKIMIAVFTHPSTPDNIHNWGRDAKTPYLLNTVFPTIELIRKHLFTNLIQRGEFVMPPIFESSSQLSFSQSEKPPYDNIFGQIKAGLNERFPPEINHHLVEFEHSAPNRLRIYFDRNRIKGSHYEICFRRDYFEFALHFESTPTKSLVRRRAFDSHLNEITNEVGQKTKSGPLENNGWMRIWYERKPETIDQEKIKLYIDQYSNFINITFPILIRLYE
jgi:hypothetical protein